MDKDDDEGVLVADDALPVLVLLTFRWGPFIKAVQVNNLPRFPGHTGAHTGACARMERHLLLCTC